MDICSATGRRIVRGAVRRRGSARVGTNQVLGGVLDRSTYTIQPANWRWACATVALALGVTIFEGSEVRSVRRGPGGVILRSRRGRLAAERVVIAANAWAVRFPPLRRAFAGWSQPRRSSLKLRPNVWMRLASLTARRCSMPVCKGCTFGVRPTIGFSSDAQECGWRVRSYTTGVGFDGPVGGFRGSCGGTSSASSRAARASVCGTRGAARST